MFAAIWDMKIGYVLCGIIWSLACGFAIGNYACSLIHRLPRGKAILDKTPYCGNCGTLLKNADLFPVFSALLLRHRCRYCAQPFPVSHTWTEIAVGLLLVFTFFAHGYGEEFLLISFIGVFLIIICAIEVNDNLIEKRILLCLAISGMIYRVLVDHSIFGFFQAALLATIFSALLWRKSIRKAGHVYILPPAALLFIAGAICVGHAQLLSFITLFAAFYALFYLVAIISRLIKQQQKTITISLPLAFSTIIHVLYQNFSLLTFIQHQGM